MARPKKNDQTQLKGFYQTAWRWHFYAGLFVIPFLLILSVTGIIYLFKPQLDRMMYPSLLLVPRAPANSKAPAADELLGAVVRAFPGSTMLRFVPPEDTDRSAEFVLRDIEGEQRSVFLNPSTGQLLGDRSESGYLQSIVKKIHGELLIGKAGDLLVELAACWALVLIFSGLYLWFPRTGGGVWGLWLPRLKSGGRVFWKDIHSVTGVYSSVFIAFFVLSGLPWTGFWGETFSRVWNRFPAGTFTDIPQSKVSTQVLNSSGDQVIPWAAERLPLPNSKDAEPTHHEPPLAPGNSKWRSGKGVISLESLIGLANSEGAPPGYSISFPSSSEGVFTVAAFTGDPSKELTIHVDQYSGEILTGIRYEQYGLVPKLVQYGIALHQGQLFGFLNQLVCLLICLLIILLSLSGVLMWWKRRPAGKLAAPPEPPDGRLWKGACVVVSMMGMAFPLVGASIVIVFLIDFLVLRRLPIKI